MFNFYRDFGVRSGSTGGGRKKRKIINIRSRNLVLGRTLIKVIIQRKHIRTTTNYVVKLYCTRKKSTTTRGMPYNRCAMRNDDDNFTRVNRTGEGGAPTSVYLKTVHTFARQIVRSYCPQ